MHFPACWRTATSTAAAAFAAVALSAAPAGATTGPSPGGCPDVPTVRAFAPWQDSADYFLAPDGDIEGGAGVWQLAGGAGAVEGNSTLAIGASSDHQSLSLPAGASATTAPMCIGAEHRTMRFAGTSATTGTLQVEALYTKSNGTQKRVVLGVVHGAGDWAASPVIPMRVNADADAYANAMSVSLRFRARANSPWQIDDVYVDPFRTK